MSKRNNRRMNEGKKNEGINEMKKKEDWKNYWKTGEKKLRKRERKIMELETRIEKSKGEKTWK